MKRIRKDEAGRWVKGGKGKKVDGKLLKITK